MNNEKQESGIKDQVAIAKHIVSLDSRFALLDSSDQENELAYDERDPSRCPSCKAAMTWSSGKKKFCPACGFVDACCN